MATVTIGPAMGASATGYGVVVDDPLALGVGEAFADAPGMTAITADQVSGASAGRSFRVSVHTPSGVLIAHLPRRRGVQVLVEHNTPGSGGMAIQEYDDTLAVHPNLWDDGNLVTVRYGDTEVKTWIMEGWGYSVGGESGERELSRSGRGNLALLDNAVLYPETALTRDTSDDRYFNFGSADGPWRRPGEWITPKAVVMSESERWPLPRKWPLKPGEYGPGGQAQWLWSSHPEKRTKQTVNYFRGEFTLAETTRVRFYSVGDDALLLLLDGEPIIRHRLRRWQTTKAITLDVRPGTHVVAAMVRNDDEGASSIVGNPGTKKSGFLFLAAQVDRKDRVQEILLRSKPNKFTVRRAKNDAPGWYPANVLDVFVTEAQARGVASLDLVSLGFTPFKDSTGRRWGERLSQSYRIGTRGLDLLQQLIERGMDVDMTPGGVVQAWTERGRDLGDFIALDGWIAQSGQGASAGLMNQALVKWKRGWAEFSDNTSQAIYGRHEGGVSAGGAVERSDARKQARAAFREYAYPEAVYTVTTSSLRGPQPFVDYDIYDVVTAPTWTGRVRCRVLSIAGVESDDGTVEWTHALYPETP